MKLSISKVSKLSLFAFVFTLFFASCEKENFDVVDEVVVDTVVPKMALTMNGATTEYNAYATYCAGDDGSVFFNVSNNQLLLDTLIISDDFMVNDFLIYYANDGTEVITLGGAAFTEDLGGVEITSVVLDAEAIITIEEANSEYVQGSMSGVFRLLSGAEVPYSVEFTAEVVDVSPWCN
ncbi:MAG: hypothetical protein KF852_19060 [Saprospiraceae bacterium]|nr:hypothetical protein [Saprospiraceae bacterium]